MTFKITGLGEYKMRNGKIASIESYNPDEYLAWQGLRQISDGTCMGGTWSDKGFFYMLEGYESLYDIIGPWQESSKKTEEQRMSADNEEDYTGRYFTFEYFAYDPKIGNQRVFIAKIKIIKYHPEYDFYEHIQNSAIIFRSKKQLLELDNFTETDANWVPLTVKKCFVITKTGLYRTRDGRKAFVSCKRPCDETDYPWWGIIEGSWTGDGWLNNGDSNFHPQECKNDIVGPWENE